MYFLISSLFKSIPAAIASLCNLPEKEIHFGIGEERFKVKKWGEKDGYSTGEIEWVDTTVDLSNDVANDEVNAVKVNVQNIRLGLIRNAVQHMSLPQHPTLWYVPNVEKENR